MPHPFGSEIVLKKNGDVARYFFTLLFIITLIFSSINDHNAEKERRKEKDGGSSNITTSLLCFFQSQGRKYESRGWATLFCPREINALMQTVGKKTCPPATISQNYQPRSPSTKSDLRD
jgi:hypothetical protein